MNSDVMQCDDRRLKRLLAASDHDAEVDPWMKHVDQCSECQSRLRELAADDHEWEKAVAVLASGDDDESCFGSDQGAQSNWNEAMVKQSLQQPSHPEMLGRLGRYEIERMIGSGGMGIVFKSFDTELNRVVAVKLLAPHLAARGSARKRFAREARAAAGVRDDHVVPIFNVESEKEPPFLVMQYVAGGSLQEKLDRDGPLEVPEVLRIGLQTAKGLAAAHAQGLIHRDVKPSNILLDEGVERALLTDFGLARTEDDACLTRSGFHPGTPHYMSPEQVRGEAIDGRSDLFGLGCVLYALCTGHSPFRADTSYAVMRRITDEESRPIRETNPDVPEWLDQIVMNLLAKSPDDRFDSAEKIADLLKGCLAHIQNPTTTPLPAPVAKLANSFGVLHNKPTTERPGDFCYPPIGKLIGDAAFAFSLILAGVLIVLELNKGTLKVESEVDDIPIRIMQGDETVKQLMVTKSPQKVRIAAGDYIVVVDGRFDATVVAGGNVSLQRGGTDVVKIAMAAKRLKLVEAGGRIMMDKPPQDDALPLVGFTEYWQHLTGMRIGGNDAGYIQNNSTLRGGLWIGEVDAGSPAAKAGLRSRDALVGLGPWEILSKGDLRFVDRQLRMGKLESADLKVHILRPGKGVLFGHITLDAKKTSNIGTLVLSSKFQPGDLDDQRFGKREQSSIEPRPVFEPMAIEPEGTTDDFTTFPTLGNGIEEVGLIVGVVPRQIGSETSFAELFLVQASGVRRIENNPTRFTQSVNASFGPETGNKSFIDGFEYYALTFATEKNPNVKMEMMAGSAHVYVMDIVGLAKEHVRRSIRENDNCEPWLPAVIPIDQQSKLAARLINLDGWEKKSDLIHTHLVSHAFHLKPGQTHTVRIVNPREVGDRPHGDDSDAQAEPDVVAGEQGTNNFTEMVAGSQTTSQTAGKEIAPKVGSLVFLKMTGDIAREYARETGQLRHDETPSEAMEIETTAEVTQRLSDGRLRIEHLSPPRVVFTDNRYTMLLATVEPSAISRETTPRGTVVSSSPDAAIESMTNQDLQTFRLTLSNLDDVVMRSLSHPLPAKEAALSELQFNRTAAALNHLLQLNGDGTTSIEKVGAPTNFMGIQDVEEIRSRGQDYVAVAARRFPPEVQQPFGQHGDGMIFLFDKKGSLEAKFGGKLGPDGTNSEDVQLLPLGTEDQWFVVIHVSQPRGPLKTTQRIYLVEDGFPLAFQIQTIRSMAWTKDPYQRFDFGYEHFFNPAGIPNREFGNGHDGKKYRSILGWDTKQRVFRGPSQLTYKDELLFRVNLLASTRFHATDRLGDDQVSTDTEEASNTNARNQRTPTGEGKTPIQASSPAVTMKGNTPYCLVWESASKVRLRREFADTLALDGNTRTAINSLLTEIWIEYIDDERDRTKYSQKADKHLVAEIGDLAMTAAG